jgi:hypothetical protein
MGASPPLMPEQSLKDFIEEVFSNIPLILQYHRHMLDNLFQRQQEQHPLVNSICDVVFAGATSNFLVNS